MDIPAIEVPSITIPVFPNFCNVAVFPASNKARGESLFFLLKKTAVIPKESGEKFWVEYLPDSIYCLLPSTEINQGSVTMYSSRPDFLDKYAYCLEINKLSINCSNTVSDSHATPTLSSGPILPSTNTSRCQKCFVNHFPRPNTKLCKLKKQRNSPNSSLSKVWPVRLSGGAKIQEEEGLLLVQPETILERGIANAKAHGINIHAGVPNLANGNCAFETVLDSISTRACFRETYNGDPDFWRRIWLTEVENVAYANWNGGLSKAEWTANWKTLKESRSYECQFGDLVLPGIAHCTKKDILIFNTSPRAYYPVYLVESSMLCNQAADNEIPICLAYDQTHYETLVPDTDADIFKTIKLKQEIAAGTYSVKMQDLFPLSDQEKKVSKLEKNTYAQVLKRSITENHVTKKRKFETSNELDSMPEESDQNRLEILKHLGGKGRSIEEGKEYRKLMDRKRKDNQSPERKEKEKKKKRETKKSFRENESLEKKQENKRKNKEAKHESRGKESLEKKQENNRRNKEAMHMSRENESTEKKQENNRRNKEAIHMSRETESIEKKQENNRRKKEAIHMSRVTESIEKKQENNRRNKEAMHMSRENESIEMKQEKNRTNKEVKQKSNPLFEKAVAIEIDKFNENDISFNYKNIGTIFEQPTCQFCKAYGWPKPLESSYRCCCNGKVWNTVKPYRKPPAALCKLLQDKHFCNNIKEYNNALALASLGIDQTPESGPNFKVLGKLYHRIGSIGQPENDKPKFAQLYFYDQENETQNRLDHQKKHLKSQVVKVLQKMLHKNNPYIKSLKSALDVCTDESNLRIVLHADAKLKPKEAHTRSYNLPLGSEVAVLLPGQQIGDLDVVLHTKGDELQQIKSVHRSYDPLHYVLLLPYGQDGFQPGLSLDDKNRISVNQFYAFHIQVRKDNFNIVLRCHKLSQQYLADMYAKVERGRLNWVYLNQKTIKVEKYQGLIDAKDNGDISEAGKTTILPPTIVGSPRWYVERYQDAMCIVRNEGKPDIFLTFTCNTHWPEIQGSLNEGETAFDRPDVCARVFKIKSDMLVKDIVESGIFGRTIAHVFTIEWQKRKGLPHMHLLITLHNDYKIRNPSDIDKFVSAELPDQIANPRLHKAVLSHMIHGPCGKNFPSSPCMEPIGNTNVKICTKDFPKDFQAETEMNEFSYPTYRRRAPKDGGRTAIIEIKGKKITIDNQSVVPYNPFLLLKYDSHINVEVVCSVVAVKYLYKYISKGPDRIILKITEENKELKRDEVARFQDCRYISASESAWKLLNQPIHGRSHAVMKLHCHLDHEQAVVFEEGSALEALERGEPDTTLTGWFKMNTENNEAKTTLYPDFPKKFTWSTTDRKWSIRKKAFNMLGRVPSVPFNLKTMEVYSLRLLLHHVSGAESYEDLRTVNGQTLPSFQAACIELGLMDDESELDKAMEEAFLVQFGEQLRSFFYSILLYIKPSNPLKFWETHKEKLSEDWVKQYGKTNAINKVLKWLKDRLILSEITLKSIGLPEPEYDQAEESSVRIIEEELNFDREEQRKLATLSLQTMNAEQSDFFKAVLNTINSETGKIFFLDAPGGTGKTFVLNALLSAVRSDGFVALATAMSAVASKLLLNGTTVHSRFKVPIQIKETSFCSFSQSDATGKLLLRTKLIIIDEVSMGHKHVFEAIDRTLRDLTNIDKPFGNKPILFAGDWRQCLPVIPKGSEGQIVNACLKFSYLWKYVEVHHLIENMRIKITGTQDAKEFGELLLSIGDGSIEGGDLITLPKDMLTEKESISELTEFVFPNLGLNHKNPNWLSERGILSPTNQEADEINTWMTQQFPGEEKLYKSCDTTDDFCQEFQSEFLNTINMPGMPAHKLTLKKGMPVMLLRNLDAKNGHCNGVKYVVVNMLDHVIEVMAISGSHPGAKLFIPRITLISTSGTLPFTMRRKQYPIRPAFAMTANKAQGQTLSRVGIYIGTDFFSHGQLYVALSRCGDRKNIKVLKRSGKGEASKVVKNVVYRAVLTHN